MESDSENGAHRKSSIADRSRKEFHVVEIKVGSRRTFRNPFFKCEVVKQWLLICGNPRMIVLFFSVSRAIDESALPWHDANAY